MIIIDNRFVTNNVIKLEYKVVKIKTILVSKRFMLVSEHILVI